MGTRVWIAIAVVFAVGASGYYLLAAPSSAGKFAVNGARIAGADLEPGNWLAHGRTYDEQRYSPLRQINRGSVDALGLAWWYDTGTSRGLEASPIVLDGVMFTTGNWGVVHALDAKTGREIWSYDPEVPGEWARYGCCDIVNRGVAVWKGRVYVASFDGRLIALDAQTGSKVWEVNTIGSEVPYTITGAPRVVKDKVIIGNGGAEYGARGYVSAYDSENGELVWRFYTVPGDPSKGFENEAMREAAKTWKGGKWWEIGGGGTAWDSVAYDPELDLLYVGVGNGSPWTREIRSPGGGDNLYLSSIIALDPDDGDLVWHYQTTPGDNWDYTATQHMILADLEIDGRTRQVIMQAPKNGFFYVLDRRTGELLKADPYIALNWATHVDMQTGRPVENPETDYSESTQFVLPGPLGGHNWQPMAYSPDTGLVYIPTLDMPGIYTLDRNWKENQELETQEGWWNTGLDFADYVAAIESLLPDIPQNRGYLKAWDPKTGKVKWQVRHPHFWNGGLLATAGGLVFQGTGDGRFAAYEDDTGKLVWEAPLLLGVIAPPVTYAVDGEQYVALMAGFGGAGGIAAADPRDAASGKYVNEGKLLVFKLGGKEILPKIARRSTDIPPPPPIRATERDIKQGSQMYMASCGLCHGALAVSGGVVPDLRMMRPAIHEQFQAIVRDGLLGDNGMAGFGDIYSREDVEKIHAYIIARARQDRQAAARADQ